MLKKLALNSFPSKETETPEASEPNRSSILRRWVALILCAVMVGLCFLYAALRADLPTWWAQHGGGVPYVMFFIAFFCTLFPDPRYLLPIVVVVALGTCGLEFMQLWQPDWLTQIRATKFGAALLGTTFVWNDMPPYFIGGLAGYAMMAAAWRFSCPIASRKTTLP